MFNVYINYFMKRLCLFLALFVAVSSFVSSAQNTKPDLAPPPFIPGAPIIVTPCNVTFVNQNSLETVIAVPQVINGILRLGFERSLSINTVTISYRWSGLSYSYYFYRTTHMIELPAPAQPGAFDIIFNTTEGTFTAGAQVCSDGSIAFEQACDLIP